MTRCSPYSVSSHCPLLSFCDAVHVTDALNSNLSRGKLLESPSRLREDVIVNGVVTFSYADGSTTATLDVSGAGTAGGALQLTGLWDGTAAVLGPLGNEKRIWGSFRFAYARFPLSCQLRLNRGWRDLLVTWTDCT
jgi:hypothetical protein